MTNPLSIYVSTRLPSHTGEEGEVLVPHPLSVYVSTSPTRAPYRPYRAGCPYPLSPIRFFLGMRRLPTWPTRRHSLLPPLEAAFPPSWWFVDASPFLGSSSTVASRALDGIDGDDENRRPGGACRAA